MGKGFGKSQKKKTAVDSLKTQLRNYARFKLSKPEEVVIFQTTKKRGGKLAIAVNQLASEFPELHFQVFSFEGTPSVGIAEKADEEYRNYCWIEQSEITNKWLVMACPPGIEFARSLSVWKDKQKAETVKQQLEPIIRSFPLKDWEQEMSSPLYMELLNSLPPDDDEAVAIFERSNGDSILLPSKEDGSGDIVI